MKRKLNKRAMALLISFVLVLTASVGVTTAYLIAKTGSLNDVFAPSKVSCAVVETGYAGEDDEQTDVSAKGSISVQNTGDVDAYIRAKVVVTWKKTDGTVCAQAPVLGTDYSMVFAGSPNWSLATDGFWYYKKPVEPGSTTDLLISSCTLEADTSVPEGYYLSVEIVASAIQATAEAVEDWSNYASAASDGVELTVS